MEVPVESSITDWVVLFDLGKHGRRRCDGEEVESMAHESHKGGNHSSLETSSNNRSVNGIYIY